MKKLMCILISAVLSLSLAACSDTEPAPVDMEPQTSQMKAICELAVMDCYYHNVAKYELKDAEGFLWWTKISGLSTAVWSPLESMYPG